MRSKRRGDISLDFTSLLDVTLIILFFFIMFSSFQSQNQTREALDSAAEMTAEAEEKMRGAEQKEKNAAERVDEMTAELEELKRTAGDNEQQSAGISEFASGENVKMIYSAENGYWKFEIRRGDQMISTVDRGNSSPDALLRALDGIPEDRYIFCECIILSAEYIESRNALDAMTKTAQERYPHLLISKTIISN